ncbi:MAG: succinic semialdehyde dehydrogenase [Anaerolineae bacterium]|nr:succinic semialdehyde dehydrogenase [Anaerolineae bacterium]MDW8172127.1 succinic semialdehyde dehydrogenase [Anaerolineae bacterium]
MATSSRVNKNGAAPREMLNVKNPLTLEVIGQIPVTSPQEVEDAAERARFAQRAWAALTIQERAKLLQNWGDLLWERQEEAIKVIRRETGKPDSGAFLELLVVDSVITYYAQNAARILAPKSRKTQFPIIQTAKVYYKPRGVVGIISPWNYPFLLPFMDLIPAMIAGNTILLKPSEVTPFSAEYGVELMVEAGIPRDVIQVLHGDGRTGAAVVDHVDFVAFTGSTEVGRIVAKRCAERLIPYSMELGGKDASIVLADADLDMTATGLLRGAMENAGQVCISVERAYVEEAIYEPLVERICYYAAQMNVGPGDGMDVHMGSMTNTVELERTEAHIADAVAKGARVIVGGKRRPDLGPLFFEPTVLVDVDHSMDIMREETFGPVLPIMKVSSVDEAVRLANDSQYGLSASIFTRDLKRGEQIALRLDTGDVSINRTQMAVGTPSLPTGGQRASGVGRRNGPEGIIKYCSTQAILIDTMIGQKPELSLADPLTLNLVKTLRVVRRFLPFI